MEAPWRNEPESASGSETDSLYRDPKETSDVPIVENSFVEETDRDAEIIVDNEKEEHKEKLKKTRRQVAVSMNKKCATCKRSSVNKVIRRHTFDAVLMTPPTVKHLPSEDENLGPKKTSAPKVILNTKALPKEARTYELEKFEKNRLIIFNQESISGFKPRVGAEMDVKVLTETFEIFGFEVKEEKNCTMQQIIEVLETFKTIDFTEYGCLGIVILTKSSVNGKMMAKDEEYSTAEIIKYFRVYDKLTFLTKPKFLIIQASRVLSSVLEFQSSGTLRKDLDKGVEPYTLPIMSDMLIVHSSYMKDAPFKDEIHGSWFIQMLCKKIYEMSPMHDLESILTEAKLQVAANGHWDGDAFKQMPSVTSTLIRKLYLRKFSNVSFPVTFLDASKSTAPTDPALDTAITPMLCQLGPCSCFLNHFDYIKKCLTHFVEEHPLDATARTFLNIADAFENEDQFNAAKERMGKAICEHLSQNARHCDFFKYLYFYKH